VRLSGATASLTTQLTGARAGWRQQLATTALVASIVRWSIQKQSTTSPAGVQ